MSVNIPIVNPLSHGLAANLVLLSVLLAPFYFLPSGLPQLSHLVIALAVVVRIMNGSFRLRVRVLRIPAVRLLLMFVFWVICVSLTWSFVFLNFKPLFYALFYVFNLMFVLMFLDTLERGGEKFGRAAYNFFALVMVLQFLIVFGNVGRMWYGYRSMGFFNNPNQLAYFALLNSSMILVLAEQFGKSRLFTFFMLLLSAGVLLKAGSRAALMAGLFQVLVYLVYARQVKVLSLAVIGGLASIPILLPILIKIPLFALVWEAYLSGDLASVANQKESDSLHGRGFDQILDNLWVLIFPQGEGLTIQRGHHIEIHSTLLTAANSYGFVGLALMVAMLLSALVHNWKLFLLCIAPLVIYGMTHNGIRQPLYYLVIATTFLVPKTERKTNKISSRSTNIYRRPTAD
nr:hypothetical protein [uncultured Shimia sp.]